MGLLEWDPQQITNLVYVQSLFVIGTSIELLAVKKPHIKKEVIKNLSAIAAVIWFLFVAFHGFLVSGFDF